MKKISSTWLFLTYSGIFACALFLPFPSFASVPQPPIITRAQRGADESVRLGIPPLSKSSSDESKGSDSTTITAAQKRIIADEYLVSKFPNEFRTDSIIKTRKDKLILRPVQINNNKIKIIIHHTARAPKSNSYEDVITDLQDIYRFHTLSRRRGDIGYNYVIGPNGEIFEGRTGGPSAVAAHAVNNNGGSIGISLMGNFDITEPSAEQLQSLISLTARLADIYNINVYEKVVYHEGSKTDPYIEDHIDDSLVGHRDTGDTACPGRNLHNKIPTIKSQVTELLGSKAPSDPTPIVTDPVRYYIPSTSYQLTIPRSTTKAVTSCATSNTIRTIKKCNISGGYLTLNLSKLVNQAHQGNHKITLQTPQGQIYLYLSLEYRPRETSLIQTQSIPSISTIPTLSKVDVMLYDLSTSQNTRDIYCQQGCSITLGNRTVKLPRNMRFMISSIPKDKSLFFRRNNKKYQVPSITVTAIGQSSITIESYKRKQGDILLNQRQGSLIWSVQDYKPIGQAVTSGVTIQNTIRLDDYMRQLILTQPSTPQSYHDAIYLAALSNIHYRSGSVTDDARIHQYYGGFNAKKLDYKRQLAHDTNSNLLLKNGSNLTYAPVFECSDGVTRNGVVDIGICPNGNLSGPGLGMSRMGALMLSQRGYTTRQIIDYYYPGITISLFD